MTEKKRGSKWWMIIVWILLLPILICIWIYKSDKIDKKFKIPAIIGVIIITFAIVGFSTMQNKQFKKDIIIECYGQTTYDKLVELDLYDDLSDISSSTTCSSLVLRDSKYNYLSIEMNGTTLSGIKFTGDNKYVFTNDKSYDVYDPKTLEIKTAADPVLKAAREEKERIDKYAKDKKIDYALAAQLLPIFEKINVSSDKANNFEKIDNWANGERYIFKYEDNQLTIYLNNDKTVNSVNLGNTGDIKLFAVGQSPKNVQDYLMSIEEYIQIQSWAKENVKSILKSPSSAKFPGGFLDPYKDWAFAKVGDLYKVSSYVDSQNSFGAMIRSEFYIEYKWDGINNGKRTKFLFNGNVVN